MRNEGRRIRSIERLRWSILSPLTFNGSLNTETYQMYLVKCTRSLAGEQGGRSRYSMRQWEFQIRFQKLLNVWSSDVILLLDLDNFEDVNRATSRSVPRSHIFVKRVNSVDPAELPVLFVHIVRSTSRVVPNPDTKVLDLQRLLLMNNVDADNLARGLLDLAKPC